MQPLWAQDSSFKTLKKSYWPQSFERYSVHFQSCAVYHKLLSIYGSLRTAVVYLVSKNMLFCRCGLNNAVEYYLPCVNLHSG